MDAKERFIMEVEVPDYFTCEDLMREGLDYFNEVLLKENKVFRLPSDHTLYSFRIAKKKNGKIDNDLPPMKMDQ